MNLIIYFRKCAIRAWLCATGFHDILFYIYNDLFLFSVLRVYCLVWKNYFPWWDKFLVFYLFYKNAGNESLVSTIGFEFARWKSCRNYFVKSDNCKNGRNSSKKIFFYRSHFLFLGERIFSSFQTFFYRIAALHKNRNQFYIIFF